MTMGRPRRRGQADDIRYLPGELSKLKLRDGVHEWLCQVPWDLFGTFTFESPFGEHSRHKLFVAAVNICNRAAFGRHGADWRDGGIQWFRSEERHSAGRPHYHALLRIPSGYPVANTHSEMLKAWRSRGIARIEVPDCQTAVISYVNKMTAYGAGLEWSQNFQRYIAGCR